MNEESGQQPIPGADPTRFAPGVGPADDPVTVAAIEQTPARQTPSEQTPGEQTPAGQAEHGPRTTNAGRMWMAVGVATVLLILLIVFIAQNSETVMVSFLGANGSISLGLAMLIAAVVGALVTLLVGTARIMQLRREVRRHRRAAAQR